jgi:hypothetical protein
MVCDRAAGDPPGVQWSRLSHSRLSLARGIVALLLVTWIPMCLLAIAQGYAIAASPRASFLLDFATYARFFVAAPLLLLAEMVIGPRMTGASERFASSGFVRRRDQPAFARAVRRLTRRRESRGATIALVALAIFGAWTFTIERIQGDALASWQTVNIGGGQALRHSLAGLWNHVIAVPIVLFLFYRWVWRLIIWTLFLRSMARLDLQLVSAHADGAGGLAFLENVQRSFGIVAFGITSILSAEVAFRMLYEGAQLASYEAALVVMLLAIELIFLGPLLVFMPRMIKARYSGMEAYSELAVRYNRDFDRKWIEGGAAGDEGLLGSADIQSLADMGNSFQFVKRMRVTPFGLDAVIRLALFSALPVLPLLLLAMPLADVFHVLSKLVL